MLLCLLASTASFAKPDESITLSYFGRAYYKYMFAEVPRQKFLDRLQANVVAYLQPACRFIVQCITPANHLLEPEFLTLPDSASLKYIFIVNAINFNIGDENPVVVDKLIDSLKAKQIARNELVHNYYTMLFTGVANKDQPFDMAKTDFKINEYHLANATEKGIFFLQCMDLCESVIYDDIFISKPQKSKDAYGQIRKFPKFDGMPYYRYTDLNFPDFQMEVERGNGLISYKGYYIDKYYELLLSHLLCLKNEKANQELVNDLVLHSVLKDRKLYPYSKNKSLLESLN